MGLLQDYAKLFGNVGSAPAGVGASNIVTVPNATAVPMPPPMIYPQHYNYAAMARPVLSDFDIELMAACISNKHPVVDGQSHCFCTLKRLERGISKD